VTLAAEKLTIVLDDESREPILREVSCACRAGRVTAIVGPNGAGKTTLLRALLGVVAPVSGRVMLNADDTRAWSAARRAAHIAYVPQRGDVALGFRVSEVVAFGGLRNEPAATAKATDEALHATGLADRRGEAFATLSLGQQQRATVARALVHLASMPAAPRVLLADEPLSAQDPASALRLCDLLAQLARERDIAVVCVMHDLSMARRLADDVVVLACDGTLAAAGPVSDTLSPAVLEPVFGVRFVETMVPLSPAPDAIRVPTILAIGTTHAATRREDRKHT
jgi:iron complex transport system ATP-binding protein